MEYLHAGSIYNLMKICDRTLTESQIAVVLKMTLMGLVYLHKMHKIHRDVKAENIFLNRNGDCKLGHYVCACVCVCVYVCVWVCVLV